MAPEVRKIIPGPPREAIPPGRDSTENFIRRAAPFMADWARAPRGAGAGGPGRAAERFSQENPRENQGGAT